MKQYYAKRLMIILIINIFVLTNLYYKEDEYHINETVRTIMFDKNFQPEIIITGQQDKNYLTVVCAYFTSRKDLNEHKDYKKWFENFLASVYAPLVIYTDQSNKEFIVNFRKRLNLTTKIIVYGNIWELMNELQTKRGLKYINNYLNIQKSKYYHLFFIRFKIKQILNFRIRP